MCQEHTLFSAVQHFRQQGLIIEYLGRLRPGKEAEIHCCRRSDGGFAVLKIYTAIAQRRFRNDADYGLGTGHATGRKLRAIQKGSAYGLQHKLALWTANEFRNLERLHAAGLPVPQPLGHSDACVLMRMIGSPNKPALQLREAPIVAETAQALAKLLCENIKHMLAADLVHGDLSPYNILWHRGRHWIIDTPQLSNAALNGAAHKLFIRDCVNTLGYLQQRGADIDPQAWAQNLWQHWQEGLLPPDEA